MFSGIYGEKILREEIHNATYNVTIKYLQIVTEMINQYFEQFSTLISESAKKVLYQHLSANITFIMQEIFVHYNTWKYSDAKEKELISMWLFQSILI